MSSDIWTRCAGTSEPVEAGATPGPIRPMRLEPWRAVEGQHVISTRKLVDSDDAQQVLEELLDASKPPVAPDVAHLHYLLFTPFRYPPLRWGSRFGTRSERGLFYASRERATCFAEVAFYRLLFLEGTAATFDDPLMVELSVFRVKLRARRAVDLTRAPFDAFEAQLASPTDYSACQALGASMRAAGVELFVFRSARAPADARGRRGANAAVIEPSAFAAPAPTELQRWLCVASHTSVELRRIDPLAAPEAHRFARELFLVDGRLPSPAS